MLVLILQFTFAYNVNRKAVTVLETIAETRIINGDKSRQKHDNVDNKQTTSPTAAETTTTTTTSLTAVCPGRLWSEPGKHFPQSAKYTCTLCSTITNISRHAEKL